VRTQIGAPYKESIAVKKSSAPPLNISSDKPKRGRPRGSKGKPRAIISIPRLGLRVNELAEATGTSRAAIKGAIARGEIKTTWIGACEIVPHLELKRLGLVADAESENKIAQDVKARP